MTTEPTDTSTTTISTDEDDSLAPAATGRDQDHDPLGAGHALPEAEAKHVRGTERRTTNQKAASPARAALYDDLSDVGTSGTQGGTQGRENQNPVGEHK